jgi:hypothetical protein
MKTVTRFIFAIVVVMILLACAKTAIETQCAKPTLTPSEGTGPAGQNITVKIETSTQGAYLRWTDISPPPPQSQWHTITGQKGDALTVYGRTLRAIAFEPGMTDSPIAEGIYVGQ